MGGWHAHGDVGTLEQASGARGGRVAYPRLRGSVPDQRRPPTPAEANPSNETKGLGSLRGPFHFHFPDARRSTRSRLPGPEFSSSTLANVRAGDGLVPPGQDPVEQIEGHCVSG
jgi:hypothetical protein